MRKVPASQAAWGWGLAPQQACLSVRGKSAPWPFSTWATFKKAEVLGGRQSPHPAAAGFFHSLLCAAFFCLVADVRASTPELRGTWLTTTASDDLAAANVSGTMSSLRQVGLNTVYVEAWKNGYTNFHSPTLGTFINSSSLNPSLGGRVLLQETRNAAATAGLVHAGWFEYGLMAQYIGSSGSPSNPLAVKARNNGWLLQDAAGNYSNTSSGYAWLNPLVPEVRGLIKGIVIDAIDQFDLQIVQFDDHLSWPVQFGYDTYTANAYRAQTGRNLPASYSNARFVSWRQDVMQDFVTELVTDVRAAHPDVIISLSPSVAAFSAANYCTSWPDYMAAGLFDEVVPQVYRSTYSSFSTEWTNQINAVGNTDEMAAGVRLLGTGAATPWTDLKQMIDRSRETNALGHSIWYSEGVSNSGNSNSSNYNAELTGYYNVAENGPAPNPHFTEIRWAGSDGGGGNGVWSTLDVTWKNRSSVWVRDATGVFAGSGGTVTVTGLVQAGGGLRFSADGYELTGDSIVLCGFNPQANTIEVGDSATATLAATLAGEMGFIKEGPGRLIVAGANTLSGVVTVRNGVLEVAHLKALPSTAVVVEGGGLTISSDASIRSLELHSGNVSLSTQHPRVLSVDALVMNHATGGGLFDLGRSRVDIAAGGSDPDQLRASIIAGRNGGTWDGDAGITSSSAANDAAFGVGYTIDRDGVMSVSWAALGDANLDGLVNFDDILSLFPNYDKAGSFTWQDGDFTYDSLVNFDDILALFPNYDKPSYLGGILTGGSGFAASGLSGSRDDFLQLFGSGLGGGGSSSVAVPEPSACGLTAAGGIIVIVVFSSRRRDKATVVL
jgi:autotransporter-associated beta strand protein